MMKARIRRLPRSLINRIAAGEIIERPASVVKELVENSLDAKSTRIKVEVAQGGMERIAVRDDGWGMVEEDLSLAVQPHATSKLASVDDLSAIETLGFRGEALASIASVSHMEIFSQTAGASSGQVLKLVGGEPRSSFSQAGTPGTYIEVKHLFFNTPVRKRQLQRPATEMAHITKCVRELALAHPEVSFQLSREGKEVLFTSGHATLDQTIVEVFGPDVMSELLPIGRPDGEFSGFIGSPNLARSRRDRQFFILNGRAIHHVGLQVVVERAFEGFLPTRRYPLIILQLRLPPQRVDVNVHPTKREVRIAQERELTGRLYHAVKRTLLGMSPPEWDLRCQSAGDAVGRCSEGRASTSRESQVRYQLSSIDGGDHGRDESGGHPLLSEQLVVLGQVDGTYVVARGPDGLYVIDQHAAHERVFYEKSLDALDDAEPARQVLTAPYAYEASPEEFEAWLEAGEILEKMGFEVEPFGDHTLLIRAVPALAGETLSPASLGDVLVRLGSESAGQDPHHAAAALAACKASVKAHDPLSDVEMRELLKALGTTNKPMTCPHGRPTVVVLKKDAIDRLFRR